MIYWLHSALSDHLSCGELCIGELSNLRNEIKVVCDGTGRSLGIFSIPACRRKLSIWERKVCKRLYVAAWQPCKEYGFMDGTSHPRAVRCGGSVVGKTAPFCRASFANLASAGTTQRSAAKLGTSVTVVCGS
jgi:hypothetical protein